MQRAKKLDPDWAVNFEEASVATPARATEIALMEEFGLPEFTELTGIGIGDYGIYSVSPAGVSLRASDGLASATAIEQQKINEAARRLSLNFSCAPATFMAWYDATRGVSNARAVGGRAKLGVSDFPLATGFAEALNQYEGAASNGLGPSVPSRDIVAAFKVKPGAKPNFDWWDRRLRNPARYGLAKARAARGGAKRPSRWYPTAVAAWLIDQGHLERTAAVHATRYHFSSYDVDLLG